MSSNKSVLSTSNLSIGYQSKKEKNIIAENLNLTFEQGKLISLVGGNGTVVRNSITQ